MKGTLFVIATPIGNLGDITLRAIETLKAVDAIASEDTRRTENLLRHLGLMKTLLRYDEHTHHQSSRKILGELEKGRSLGLVTDAGTPGVSDPGRRLVEDVVNAGFSVVPIPGPSAVTAAVSAAGLQGEGFVFLGFLSRRPGRAKRELREALGFGKNVVVFESPFRLTATLEWIREIDPNLTIAVARELTKVHEEFIRGRVDQVIDELKKRPQKGEAVLIIGGPGSAQD